MTRTKWFLLYVLAGALYWFFDGELKGNSIWHAKQFLPLTYLSEYLEDNKSILCQWRMWGGRCFNVRSWELAK